MGRPAACADQSQWDCALDPELQKPSRADRSPEQEDTCSMCGKFCAVRSMNKALNGEHIDIQHQYITRKGTVFIHKPFLFCISKSFLFRPSFGVTDCFVPPSTIFSVALLRAPAQNMRSMAPFCLLSRSASSADGESRKISCPIAVVSMHGRSTAPG